jgi:hypothetical protein
VRAEWQAGLKAKEPKEGQDSQVCPMCDRARAQGQHRVTMGRRVRAGIMVGAVEPGGGRQSQSETGIALLAPCGL